MHCQQLLMAAVFCQLLSPLNSFLSLDRQFVESDGHASSPEDVALSAQR
jgi:hypothetical protein